MKYPLHLNLQLCATSVLTGIHVLGIASIVMIASYLLYRVLHLPDYADTRIDDKLVSLIKTQKVDTCEPIQ